MYFVQAFNYVILIPILPFHDRFTNEDDKEWFEACITRVVKQQIGEEYLPKLAKEPYFVDFLRDAPEPTGEEDEDADFDAPKIYEEVVLVLANNFLSWITFHFQEFQTVAMGVK